MCFTNHRIASFIKCLFYQQWHIIICQLYWNKCFFGLFPQVAHPPTRQKNPTTNPCSPHQKVRFQAKVSTNPQQYYPVKSYLGFQAFFRAFFLHMLLRHYIILQIMFSTSWLPRACCNVPSFVNEEQFTVVYSNCNVNIVY